MSNHIRLIKKTLLFVSSSAPSINDEFNRLNANLVARAAGEAIFNVAAWTQSMRRCTMKEGTIMTKSLLTGLAVCAAVALFAGNANAYARKAYGHAYAYVNRSPMHVAQRTWESLRAKGGPLHDCAHVIFPQCNGHDFGGEPND